MHLRKIIFFFFLLQYLPSIFPIYFYGVYVSNRIQFEDARGHFLLLLWLSVIRCCNHKLITILNKTFATTDLSSCESMSLTVTTELGTITLLACQNIFFFPQVEGLWWVCFLFLSYEQLFILQSFFCFCFFFFNCTCA